MDGTAVSERLAAMERECGETAKQARDAAFAASLRVMAALLRSEAEAKVANAQELERWAIGIESGAKSLPPSGRRVVLGFEDGEQQQARGDDVPRVRPLDEEPRSEEMALLLDMFGPRTTGSPWFKLAVADAAELGLSIAGEEDRRSAAEWIAQMVVHYEMEAA